MNYINQFKEYLEQMGFASSTLDEFSHTIKNFMIYAESHKIFNFNQITKDHLTDYVQNVKSKKGHLSRSREASIKGALKRYFSFLSERSFIQQNPALDLILPKRKINQSNLARAVKPISPYEYLINKYSDHLRQKGMSKRSLVEYPRTANECMRFLKDLHIHDIKDILPEHLRMYQNDLFIRTFKGKALSMRTIRGKLLHIQMFFRYLNKSGFIYLDPSFLLEMPRLPKSLPRHILEAYEIESLLRAIPIEYPIGKRDMAIIELVYSCGLRSSEVYGLKLENVSLKKKELRFWGKGNKEAVIPFGESAAYALSIYLSEARSKLINLFRGGTSLGINGNPYVFISKNGKRLDNRSLNYLLKKYAVLAGLEKKITLHGIRHSCATHLLKNGADIRLIQKLLRHESLNTTQVYTRVENSDLQEALHKYHPREMEFKRQGPDV